MAAPTIGRRLAWSPPVGAVVDWSHPLSAGLVLMSYSAGNAMIDAVRGATAPGFGAVGTGFGRGSRYTGSQTSTSSFPVRMDTASQMTFRWLGSWDAFASGDKLALSAPGGVLLDPDSSTGGTAAIKFGFGAVNTGTNSTKSYTRWTAGRVVHIAASNNFSTTNGHTAYFNGNLWTPSSTDSTPATTGTVADDSLYIMSNGGASLKATGTVVSIAIWRRVLTAAEHAQLAADPFCMLRY